MKKYIFLTLLLNLICLTSEAGFLNIKKTAKHTTVKHEDSVTSTSNTANLSNNDDELDKISLRDEPNGKIISYLKDVDEVVVIKKQGNWYEVETSQGSGFIDKKWVEIDEFASGVTKEGVLEDDTEVFDDDGKIIGTLSENTKVEIIGSDDDDYKIKYKNSYGYISKDVLDEDDDNDENNNNNDDDEDDEVDNSTNGDNEDTDDDDDTNSESLEDNDADVFENEYHFIFSNPGEYKIIIGKIKRPAKVLSSSETKENNDENKITDTKITSESSSEKTVKNNTNNTKTKSDKTDKSNKTKKKKDNKNKKELELKVDKKLNTLLKGKDVKVSKKLTRNIGKTWDEKGIDYKNVQGFCTDGEYWYIALMTSTTYNGKKDYTKQHTKLLKIRIKDKKVVAEKHVGKIGHSNSLTYNNKTKKILSASCSKEMGCIYEFNASDLGGKKTIYLKDKKGKKMTKKCIASFSYDQTNDQYIVKLSNTCLGYFDSDFKLKKKVTVKHLKINDKMTGQAITCDGKNIFSVCNNLSVNPRINYILIYSLDGKYIRSLTFKKELGTSGERPEMEQLTCYKGKYWSLTNVHGKFRIHKIKLR